MSAPRRITGFHQDELGDWVAELECGHAQHVRHEPPLMTRPWVLTEAGRAGRLGTLLECGNCVVRTMNIPEVWLRGPVEGIHPILQPAAHAIIQVGEDVLPIVADLTPDQLWARPGGVASIGFHLLHIPGSLDRLLSYSRGAELTDQQRQVLAAERTVHEDRPDLAWLLARFDAAINAAVVYLRTVPEPAILEAREVGRKRLPSNTLGLIFHAAEHSSRHAGQIVTLNKVVRP